MEAHVVVRQVTAAASHFRDLEAAVLFHPRARADRIPVHARRDELHRHPPVPGSRVVPQQCRAVVHVDHEDVEVPVVVHVPKRGPAARLLDGEPAS